MDINLIPFAQSYIHPFCPIFELYSTLQELTALFGSEWAIKHLVPSIAEIKQHQSYLRRLTAVQACALMTSVMEPDIARTELLPMVLDMASDAVSISII